jgi:hypothetical protein
MALTAPQKNYDAIANRRRGQRRVSKATVAAGLMASMGTMSLVGAFAVHANATTAAASATTAGSTGATGSTTSGSTGATVQTTPATTTPTTASSSSTVHAKTGGS